MLQGQDTAVVQVVLMADTNAYRWISNAAWPGLKLNLVSGKVYAQGEWQVPWLETRYADVETKTYWIAPATADGSKHQAEG